MPLVGIPTTLHASLLARLDRLASVRLVAQIGAAIGREFSYALLHAVSRLPEDELQASLARLVASELVFQRGTPPDAIYAFKHGCRELQYAQSQQGSEAQRYRPHAPSSVLRAIGDIQLTWPRARSASSTPTMVIVRSVPRS